VIEIDAASNRGIEDVRALKDKAYLLPSKLSKKVFIIDEVHMLTKEAFNALLKLIEEPPVHTIFVLCTTDEGKIPETVLSRLIKVSFHKGNKEELRSSLERVIEGERAEVEEGAVEMIIGKSDGSFRNLQKTFNEIFLEFGKKISKKDTVKFFEGKTGEYTSEEMEEDLVVGEVKTILIKLEKMAEVGVDFKAFRENLIDYFQGKLLGIYGVEGKGVSKMEAGDLEKWLGLLIAAGKQEKDIAIDQLPLELAVVELLKNKKPETRSQKSETREEKPETRSEKPEVKDINLAIEAVKQDWGKVLMAVKPFNHSVEAFLRAARPKTIKGDKVVLEVFYPFHKDKLEEQKNREIVEKGLNLVFGMEVSFECVLSEGKGKPLVISNDTPVEKVSEKLRETTSIESNDIYDVAKQIFG
jgi:DNA polymerase-3 subunit gamma/tau